MTLKEQVNITFESSDLKVVHKALSSLPFGEVVGLMQHIEDQLNKPENLTEDQHDDG